MRKSILLVPFILFIAGCSIQNQDPVITQEVAETTPIVIQEPQIVTGSITQHYEKQPTVLPGEYNSNGDFLRKWAIRANNIRTFDIPADAKDVSITFKLAHPSKYSPEVPGNVQAFVDGKNIFNGRLSSEGTMTQDAPGYYTYSLNHVTTQDHPKGVDLSSAIGKTLTIKARIGESNNYLEYITIDRVQ